MCRFASKLKSDDFWASLNGFIVLAIVIVAVWIGNFFLMPLLFPDTGNSTGNAGTAGDMFGGLTALFSGLAFAGLVTTLFMQRKELELQRNELKQTREVFSIQRFENTFFGLLRLLTEYIQAMRSNINEVEYFTDGKGKDVFGKEVLELYAKKLPNSLRIKKENGPNSKYISDGKYTHQELIGIYEDRYRIYYERNLGPYFRLIYNIVRLIENNSFDIDLDEDNKTKLMYSKILRAYLSSAEIKLLMFNCASVHGKGLKYWVEKHSLLKHITRDDYTKYTELVNVYDSNAFQFSERA